MGANITSSLNLCAFSLILFDKLLFTKISNGHPLFGGLFFLATYFLFFVLFNKIFPDFVSHGILISMKNKFESLSGFKPGAEKISENIDRQAEQVSNAMMFFKDFLALKPGEKVLFLSHEDQESSNPEILSALKESLDRQGIKYKEFVANKDSKTSEVVSLLKDYQVIWSSNDWDHTNIDFYEIADEQLPKTGGRMVEAAGLTAEALNNNGMLGERLEVLQDRIKRMHEKLRDAIGFHIRTSYGTDLSVGLRLDKSRKWGFATGEIDPGEWDNPGAEIYTTPHEEKVNGVLMLPALQDEVTADQGVDQFVRLEFRNGKIAKIDGGKSAEKLRRYLQKESRNEENPLSVIQSSEIAFGASKYARSYVSNPEKLWRHLATSTVEAEKRMGTMHLAIGSAKHGEEGVEGFTESNVHLDFVIPRHGLTVEAFYRDDDFSKKKNGTKLINEGGWNFI